MRPEPPPSIAAAWPPPLLGLHTPSLPPSLHPLDASLLITTCQAGKFRREPRQSDP
jgi:hypothetical protein